MHVPFRIHYRNNLIDKKDSYPIPRPPSWDDHNCSYGHQLYHSEHIAIHNCIKYIDILFSAHNDGKPNNLIVIRSRKIKKSYLNMITKFREDPLCLMVENVLFKIL